LKQSFVLARRALTERIIGFAIEGHRTLCPEPREVIYAECLCPELAGAGILYVREVVLISTRPL
jgi:PD-(D/E)XK nuclease superfamily